MNRRLLAALTAAVMLAMSFSFAFPATALGDAALNAEGGRACATSGSVGMPDPYSVHEATVTVNEAPYSAPDGYNEHDYFRLLAFLEEEDADGVKNGSRLSYYTGGYDPADPETWWRDGVGEIGYYGIKWGGSPEKRIEGISFDAYKDRGYYFYGTLDASGCTSLTEVSCAFNALTELDLSGCTSLKEVYCYHNELVSLSAAGCSALESISCDENRLTKLDFSGCVSLDNVGCADNALTELNVTDCTVLYGIDCSDNVLESIDLSGCPSLFYFYCDGNILNELDLSENVGLGYFSCRNNNLRELDLSGCPQLQALICDDNYLTGLDVSGCEMLKTLHCRWNRIAELDLSHNPELDNLSCRGNLLRELDLSANPLLGFDRVSAEGDGTIGYYCDIDWDDLDNDGYANYAIADSIDNFIGWYSEDGVFISSEGSIRPEQTEYTRVVARFTGDGPVVTPDPTDPPTPTYPPLPAGAGDANGDGEVTAADALLVLRYALRIGELPCDESLCDMNGDGVVNMPDALLVLRIALGLMG